MSASATSAADSYIQQLANSQLEETIKKYSEKLANAMSEIKQENHYSPPAVHRMTDMDYLILGADSREKITNYVYRGMISNLSTNDKFAESYTFYYIDEFGNLHSTTYNRTCVGKDIPNRITHNLPFAYNPISDATKLKSPAAISFIRNWTMELTGEFVSNKTTYFADNDVNEAYDKLENGTADVVSITKLRYQKRRDLSSTRYCCIEDIQQQNSDLQINNIDLLYRIFRAAVIMVDNVRTLAITTRDNNTVDRYKACALEAAQISLKRSADKLTQEVEFYTRYFITIEESTKDFVAKLAAKLDKDTKDRAQELSDKSAELDAREFELNAAETALNESRDKFDIYMAVTERDLDKIAAEKAEHAILVERLSLDNEKRSIDEYREKVYSISRQQEESTLMHHTRVMSKICAVNAAQVALDIARNEFDLAKDKFEIYVATKTKELEAHEKSIDQDTHRLYSMEYKLEVQQDEIEAANIDIVNKTCVLDARKAALDRQTDLHEGWLFDLTNQQERLNKREAELAAQQDREIELDEQEAYVDTQLAHCAIRENEFEKVIESVAVQEKALLDREYELVSREDMLSAREALLSQKEIELEARNAELAKSSEWHYDQTCALEDRIKMITFLEQRINAERTALAMREETFKLEITAHNNAIRNVRNELNNIIKQYDVVPADCE